MAAAAPVAELALPTKRDEAWRYAPHARLGELSFGPSAGSSAGLTPAMLDELVAKAPVIDGPRVVVVNGTVDAGRSALTDLPAGLTVTGLADVATERPDAVAAHFDAASDPADAFVAINAAYGRDGAVIEVADDAQVGPIHVIDVTVAGPDHNATATGIVVHLGDRAGATVIETHIGGGETAGGANTRTTVTVGVEATLEHLMLQDAPANQIDIARLDINQGAGSTLLARCFNLGASYGRVDYQVHLAGEGATADLAGLYFGFGDQTLDQQITVIHGAKDCISRQAFRGVLDDASTGVFNGGIDVSPGADGTDAEQSNDNLLLSDRAEINTQPRLEILADDVACKHGATVGQLDETALYYMRSRGIPALEARRLLINSFADQTVDLIAIDTVRAWVTARLGHDLDQVGAHGHGDDQVGEETDGHA